MFLLIVKDGKTQEDVRYLNTSHVLINQFGRKQNWKKKSNLNTSHVLINPIFEHLQLPENAFKYISCSY